jgi:hypothetical protein
MSFRNDLVARFHGAFAPAHASHMNRSGEFEKPVLHVAVVSLPVHSDYTMWIAPFGDRDSSRQGNGFVKVIASGTVMREQRRRKRERAGQHREQPAASSSSDTSQLGIGLLYFFYRRYGARAAT